MWPTCISCVVLSIEDFRSLIFRNSYSLQKKIRKLKVLLIKKQNKYAGYCDTIIGEKNYLLSIWQQNDFQNSKLVEIPVIYTIYNAISQLVPVSCSIITQARSRDFTDKGCRMAMKRLGEHIVGEFLGAEQKTQWGHCESAGGVEKCRWSLLRNIGSGKPAGRAWFRIGNDGLMDIHSQHSQASLPHSLRHSPALSARNSQTPGECRRWQDPEMPPREKVGYHYGEQQVSTAVGDRFLAEMW